MHVQVGTHGVGYVGTQAAFVFIVTMIQGSRPPDSIMPGIDRFAGITGGLGILLIVSMLLVAERSGDRRGESSGGLTQAPMQIAMGRRR